MGKGNEMRSYEDYVARKQREHGDRFDSSDLAEKFIPYYENQNRIEVDFGYEIKRGRIGVTTGCKPAFLLMLTTRSLGSSHLLNESCEVLKVVCE